MGITLTVSYKTESRKKLPTVRRKNGNKVPPISYIYSSLIGINDFLFLREPRTVNQGSCY